MSGNEERVRTSFEAEGVALLTVSGPPPNPSTFACVDQLAEQLEQARDDGARVVVIASEVDVAPTLGLVPGCEPFSASLKRRFLMCSLITPQVVDVSLIGAH